MTTITADQRTSTRPTATKTTNKDGSTTVEWSTGETQTFRKGQNIELEAGRDGGTVVVVTWSDSESQSGSTTSTPTKSPTGDKPSKEPPSGAGQSAEPDQPAEADEPAETTPEVTSIDTTKTGEPTTPGTYFVQAADGTTGWAVVSSAGSTTYYFDDDVSTEGGLAVKHTFEGVEEGTVISVPFTETGPNERPSAEEPEGDPNESEEQPGEDTNEGKSEDSSNPDDDDNDKNDNDSDDPKDSADEEPEDSEPSDSPTPEDPKSSSTSGDDYAESRPAVSAKPGSFGADFKHAMDHPHGSEDNERRPGFRPTGPGADAEHAQSGGKEADDNESRPGTGKRGEGSAWYNALGGSRAEPIDGWTGNSPRVLLPLTALNMSPDLMNAVCGMTSAEFFVVGARGTVIPIPQSGIKRAPRSLRAQLRWLSQADRAPLRQ